MSLPITRTDIDAPSKNMPNVMEDRPPSSSPGIFIFLQSLCLIGFVYACIITAAGISLRSANNAGYLAVYWVYMTGTSCLVTLSGWSSAQRGRTYVPFWRIALLHLFLGHIFGGMVYLPGTLNATIISFYGIIAVAFVGVAGYALDWVYGNATTPAGNRVQNKDTSSMLSSSNRWVGGIPTTQLFSGGREQEVGETLPSNHEMTTLGTSGQEHYLSSAESTPSEEKEHLLSNADHIV
ncbi:hypothetical protein HD554DRAFT_1527573 [Boletus coccyginus]|nr:hypothetical protein HD554DRAFT_1527573 [Boletus coccyginus]